MMPPLGIYLRYTTGLHDTRTLDINPAVKDEMSLEKASTESFFAARKTTFNVGIIGAPKLGSLFFFGPFSITQRPCYCNC